MFNGPFHPSVEAYGFWKLSQIITMNAYKKDKVRLVELKVEEKNNYIRS